MKYTVYLRTNLVNGKQYVGQTKNLKKRENYWYSLKSNYANNTLTEDREKYGLENFNLEILAIVETREEACELERKYIKELNTLHPNGYNMACGGKNNTGCGIGKHNGKEFKKGDIPWNKGVKECFSEEVLMRMSEKHKGKHHSPETEWKKGTIPWIKGKHHSEESKEKNRLAHLGKISKKRKPVVQFSLDWKYIKEFTHCMAAAKEMGFKRDENIRRACKEDWRTSGGFKWMYKEDYEKMLGEKNS